MLRCAVRAMKFLALMLMTLTPAFAAAKPSNIVIVGDSLASGFGVAQGEAFPEIIQEKIEREGLPFRIINKGVGGRTSGSALERLPELLKQRVDVLILELGGNDFLRGIDPSVTKSNLKTIINATRRRYPNARIVLVGMELPPVIDSDHLRNFNRIFADLAQHNDVAFVPFFLKGAAGVPGMMAPDRIHPTAAGQKVLAENLWAVLKPLLAATAVPAESAPRGF
jgi:acyl-CoA thioesterase I